MEEKKNVDGVKETKKKDDAEDVVVLEDSVLDKNVSEKTEKKQESETKEKKMAKDGEVKEEEPEKEKSEKKEEPKKEKLENGEEPKKEAESKKEKPEKEVEPKKEAVKQEEKAQSNKAVTQSKRLAEAKEASKKQAEKAVVTANSKKKRWCAAAVCLLVLLFGAYLAGVVFYSGHYFREVTINGVNVSGMNKESAKNTLNRFYEDYTLTIETIDDKTIVIDGKDIDIQISLHDDFSQCMKQQKPALWFVNYFKSHAFDMAADVSWNDEKLQEIFDDMKILDTAYMVKPKDAYVGVKDGKFTIIQEVLGNTIQKKVFYSAVEDSLNNVQKEMNLKEDNCYELPAVYQDDKELQKELSELEQYSECEIVLQLDDLVLEPGMELYEAVLEKKGDSYEVSEKLVKKYVENLAKQYDTMETERSFTTSFQNRKVDVYGSAFGYRMNQEETTKTLFKALKAKKKATVDVVFEEKGISLQGENDIGDTYIEVNLSEQKVFGYKNGKKIAEGDCVSGKEAAGNGTCIGLYKIQDKLSPTVLRGEKKPVTKTETKKNKKGKKVKKTTTTYEYEYESPVTYWIQFNGGIGLHDAAGWRSQYGGSIYYYSGSHGCVNLPLDLAKKLYENFEVGDPVVVYFWDNENRK